MKPIARREDILTSEFEDGLIVYDTARHEAHDLNRAAAAVWRLCDGGRNVHDIAVELSRELNLPADEELVWLAIRHLRKAHLLLGVPARAPRAATSRRQLLRRLGLAGSAALLLPLVTSIVVPTTAMAQSGGPVVPTCNKHAVNIPNAQGQGCTDIEATINALLLACAGECINSTCANPETTCAFTGEGATSGVGGKIETIQLPGCPNDQGVRITLTVVECGCDCF